MNYSDHTIKVSYQSPEFISPDRYQLQDLWHYARAIRDGGSADSGFATSSLWERLDLVRDAEKCINRTEIPDGDFCLHPNWDEITNRLDARAVESERQLAEVGQELLELVDRECAALGVDGRTCEVIQPH